MRTGHCLLLRLGITITVCNPKDADDYQATYDSDTKVTRLWEIRNSQKCERSVVLEPPRSGVLSVRGGAGTSEPNASTTMSLVERT
jgi:hypothetical protein